MQPGPRRTIQGGLPRGLEPVADGVTLPGLGSRVPILNGGNEGTVHVTAHHTTSKRCELVGFHNGIVAPGSPIPLYVDVACHTAAGGNRIGGSSGNGMCDNST